jgi:two-component system cell cycle sensor histidine kinase/response regulator CckA
LQTATISEDTLKMETILLVDPEPVALTLCQRMLTVGGYGIVPVSSAEEALRLLQNDTPKIDLALLDVMMPDMNGVELADRIRSLNPSIKIVLMSGYGSKEIARVVDSNPYGIIFKPFKTESLLRMIENALGNSTKTPG